MKDNAAEATSRLCVETDAVGGSSARDSVAAGFNAP